MNISRVGILLFITALILGLSGCGIINKVRARNDLNDGAKAYKDRKFDVAETKFRSAMELDPDNDKTPILLARSLHQQYLARRDTPENKQKAEQAIEIYKKILEKNPNDEVSNRAVSNLIELTHGQDALVAWLAQRADDTKVSGENRADAYTSLASKQYTCANEITEQADVKQNVVKDNKASYVFKKPQKTEDYDKLKQCAQKGMDLIDKALALDQNDDSTWSYKASLLVQQARIAEMDNNQAEKDRLMKESETAKQKFLALSEEKARKKEEEERKKKEEEEKKK